MAASFLPWLCLYDILLLLPHIPRLYLCVAYFRLLPPLLQLCLLELYVNIFPLSLKYVYMNALNIYSFVSVIFACLYCIFLSLSLICLCLMFVLNIASFVTPISTDICIMIVFHISAGLFICLFIHLSAFRSRYYTNYVYDTCK